MKRLAVAAAVVVSTAGSALAQDASRVGVDWSGVYVGAFAGGANGDASYTNVPVGIPDVGAIDGGLAGLKAGYRFQYGPAVVGVSVDGALANVKGMVGSFNHARFKVEWLATANAQLGLAFGRALVYGTAGGALVGLQHDYDSVASVDVSYPRRTHSGYAVGGGAEYAFADKASISFEIRHFVLEEETFPQVLNVMGHAVDANFTAGTIGLNVRF
ncbi:outer membrane protein [Aminobacter aganoensis]|uniref:Outer membrane immunogenic protein n=1 Tax=Aminobacter aganoensis TaxID=83264 RepID=A0A7X0FAN7_9HYPH|nr:outer membrane beta-barrel protein [Aminobacter aganoensis]MBB6355924.1 outer membrane immunogenic protein [Aminobacter aganoensis]